MKNRIESNNLNTSVLSALHMNVDYDFFLPPLNPQWKTSNKLWLRYNEHLLKPTTRIKEEIFR